RRRRAGPPPADRIAGGAGTAARRQAGAGRADGAGAANGGVGERRRAGRGRQRRKPSVNHRRENIMRQLGILTAVALTLAVGATSRAGGPGDKDKEQLQGTWTLTNLAYDGKDVPLPAGKTVTLTFTGDKV